MRSLLLLACSLLAACGGDAPAAAPPRLVVLLATCTLRKDVLAPYEARVAYTPNLAALAKESVVFPRHEAEAGQSGTDFAAIFSGTQCDVNGVYYHPHTLDPELDLVGEVFARGGYETWFLNGHRMASSDLGYGQGIQHDLDLGGQRKHRLLDANDGALRGVLAALAAQPAKRAFVLANFTLTHEPYTKQVTRAEVLAFVQRFPDSGNGVSAAELERWWDFYEQHRLELQWNLPPTAAALDLSAADLAELARVLEVVYRTSVEELDRVVGELVDAIRAAGLWNDTVFCFTADHGEALYREGLQFHWTHGLQLAPEVLSVPWLLRAPGVASGTYPAVTRSIDVLPTLAGLCGLAPASEPPPAPPREGHDLAPVLHGRARAPELLAFAHTSVVGALSLETFAGMTHVLRLYPRTDPELCWVRVRSGDLVVQRVNTGAEHWQLEAYDLAEDPLQLENRFDPADARQQKLVEALEAYRARLVAAFARSEQPVDAEALERMRELGYAR